jgi:hypothetical protein
MVHQKHGPLDADAQALADKGETDRIGTWHRPKFYEFGVPSDL